MVVSTLILLVLICSGSAIGETNVQGEDQKKLDVIANELFINMLKSSYEVWCACHSAGARSGWHHTHLLSDIEWLLQPL